MSIITAIGRLSLTTIKPINLSRSISTSNINYIKTTPCLFAEPLKKKKRIDPAVLKARDDRKKKKIEKQIRKLEKNAQQLKPIDECLVPLELFNNKEQYGRTPPVLTAETLEQRVLLQKKWSNYRRDQHLADIQMIDRILYSQQHALDELRKESEELYQEAIQIDLSLTPFKSEGPVSTPASNEYEAPDGDYVDVSKKW